MYSATPAIPVTPTAPCSPEADAFVRFCYQRRKVGWPELYDEMCLVATRGLFRGMGTDALAEVGVGFSLFETTRLAAIVTRIVTEEQAARRAARAAALEAARVVDDGGAGGAGGAGVAVTGGVSLAVVA